MNKNEHPGLYVHVPFCRTKCPYCDFYSIAHPNLIPMWLEAVQKEIVLYKDKFSVFDSLYMGGGTPSLLNSGQLEILLGCLRRHFSFAEDSEITIEVNPDDVTAEGLAAFLDFGINRISIGVQSFSEEELLFLERRHSARQTFKALELIRSSAFNNLSLDLMYGLQDQTESEWLKNLESAMEFEPEHISCYQLTMEEGTTFGRMKAQGQIQLPDEAAERKLFLATSRFLEKQGYIHYEISNFARQPTSQSRHNLKYWNHVPYLGLGPSAHSFKDGVRWWNVRSVDSYSKALSAGIAPVENSETLSPEELDFEALFLGLRTRDGIDLKMIPMKLALNEGLTRLQESRYIRIHNGRLKATHKGFLIADTLPLLLSD